MCISLASLFCRLGTRLDAKTCYNNLKIGSEQARGQFWSGWGSARVRCVKLGLGSGLKNSGLFHLYAPPSQLVSGGWSPERLTLHRTFPELLEQVKDTADEGSQLDLVKVLPRRLVLQPLHQRLDESEDGIFARIFVSGSRGFFAWKSKREQSRTICRVVARTGVCTIRLHGSVIAAIFQ